MKKKDLYGVLWASRTDDKYAIEVAYRRLAFRHHPDRNPGDEQSKKRFEEVQLAYEVLSDPERRARYDATGEYEETAPDNTHIRVTKALSEALAFVLEDMLKRNCDPLREDLIAFVKGHLMAANRVHAGSRAVAAVVLEKLKGVAGRFVEPERGLAAACVRGQIFTLEAEVASSLEKEAANREALEYLQGCSYRVKSWLEDVLVPEGMKLPS